MGRIYTVVDTGTAFGTPAGDILQIVCSSVKTIKIHSFVLTCQTETDDSTVITMSRFATIGSGGVSINANPIDPGDNGDSATILARNTTDASSTETRMWAEGMSILAGLQKIWTPETRPTIPPNGNLVFKSIVVLTTDVTFTTFVEFEEIG